MAVGVGGVTCMWSCLQVKWNCVWTMLVDALELPACWDRYILYPFSWGYFSLPCAHRRHGGIMGVMPAQEPMVHQLLPPRGAPTRVDALQNVFSPQLKAALRYATHRPPVRAWRAVAMANQPSSGYVLARDGQRLTRCTACSRK